MENRIILGTVNMGMDYGPDKYRVPENEAYQILTLAEKHDLTLDTAAAYGEAEMLLGEFKYHGRIVTKLPPWCKAEDVLHQIKERQRLLNKTPLYTVLLHTESQIYDIYTVAALVEAKKRGYVENIGVSVYNYDIAIIAAKMGIDVIQIPFNVFDCGLYFTHFFDIAKANNVKIYARSAFLQGYLLKKPENPEILTEINRKWPYYSKNFDIFGQICQSYGFSRSQLALLFSLLTEGIDKVVIGVDSLKQLEEDLYLGENFSVIDFFRDGESAIDELLNQFQHLDYQIPSLWKERK
jgi:aryl-alcohol dehydrogenase-like predicted oxidoreductase